jgi:hypothetical protein
MEAAQLRKWKPGHRRLQHEYASTDLMLTFVSAHERDVVANVRKVPTPVHRTANDSKVGTAFMILLESYPVYL